VNGLFAGHRRAQLHPVQYHFVGSLKPGTGYLVVQRQFQFAAVHRIPQIAAKIGDSTGNAMSFMVSFRLLGSSVPRAPRVPSKRTGATPASWPLIATRPCCGGTLLMPVTDPVSSWNAVLKGGSSVRSV